MVFPWKLLVSSIYPCYFTGAYLGMDHFIIYFEWDFHSFGSGHVLVLGLWSFLSCCFLHSLFLELLLLDVDIPQLILQFSYLFSSVVHLCLVIGFLGYFFTFYFLVLLLKYLFWLSLSFISQMSSPPFIASVPSKLFCYVCLLACFFGHSCRLIIFLK